MGQRAPSVEALVDLAVFDGRPRSHRFWSSQKRTEISALLEMVRARNPQFVCEIGAYNGGTLFLLSQVSAPNARIYSLDISYPDTKKHLYRKFARRGQQIICMEADSHSPETVEQLKRSLGGHQLDFLFIDGDHSYAGVKTDFELYAPLVRKGGLIALHDIVFDHWRSRGIKCHQDSGEVPVFWKEMKDHYRYHEFIDDPDQSGFGIGVIEW